MSISQTLYVDASADAPSVVTDADIAAATAAGAIAGEITGREAGAEAGAIAGANAASVSGAAAGSTAGAAAGTAAGNAAGTAAGAISGAAAGTASGAVAGAAAAATKEPLLGFVPTKTSGGPSPTNTRPSSVIYVDTRGVDSLPGAYAFGEYHEFKATSDIGLPGLSGYVDLVTRHSWTGGGAVGVTSQTGYNKRSGQIFTRTGVYPDNTVWGPWYEMWTAQTFDPTTKADVAAVSLATLSVAALRARTGTRPPFVRLVSGTADNGGLFEWVAASTTTDDGALYIKETAVATGRWHRVIQDRTVLVDWFGAVPNSSGTDSAAAINAAELAAAAIGATVRFKEGVDYYFKAALLGNRDRLSWRGYNTRLIYNGASTTIDLVTIGNDATSKFGAVVTGLAICSLTTMTAGNALRTPLLSRSIFRLDNIQGQDFYQTNGNKLYNGIYADRVDCVEFWANACIAQNKGFTVRGALSTGPKADCWVNIGKIGWCAVGIHVGGAFGGLFLTPQTTLILNGINMRVDRLLTAETNREIFATGTIFDVSTNASEANIVLDDPGSVLYTFSGVWIASAAGKGLWIKQHGGKLAMAGCRVFNNAGDGFRSDVGATSIVAATGTQIHDNGGYGINFTVAGHSLTQTGTTYGGNVSGDVNDTARNAAGPATLVQELFGVANGSGSLTIAHGDANLPNKLLELNAYYQSSTGVAKPLVMLHMDGTNLVFVTDAAAASKACRVYLRQRLSSRWA